ncbi:MAG: hypothetical protein ABMB14_08490 [Myxococcota bacterium]
MIRVLPVIATVSTVFFAGCGTPEPEVQAFAGPGWDDATAALVAPQDEYLVGITHLRVINWPGPGKRFGEHAEAVANYLYDEEPEGWVGASFRNVGKLEWWTLTVWESEEAQTAFVLGDVHAAAMADLSDVAKGAESRSLWVPAADIPPDWDTALDWLADDTDFAFGEL